MRGDRAGELPSRRAPGALPWHRVDELTSRQVAMMQSLDEARRAGLISTDDFAAIETIIRRDHVQSARRQLIEAKRRKQNANGGC